MGTMHRRRLPHFDDDGTVFTTWRIFPGSPPLSARERDIAYDALVFFAGKRFALYAGVIMDDHVHVLARPHRDYSLSQLKHSWKSFSANRMQRETGRSGSVWQDECYDRTIAVDGSYQSTFHYIVNNPFKRWPSLRTYRWIFSENARERDLSASPVTGAEAGPTDSSDRPVTGAEAGPTDSSDRPVTGAEAGPTDARLR